MSGYQTKQSARGSFGRYYQYDLITINKKPTLSRANQTSNQKKIDFTLPVKHHLRTQPQNNRDWDEMLLPSSHGDPSYLQISLLRYA